MVFDIIPVLQLINKENQSFYFLGQLRKQNVDKKIRKNTNFFRQLLKSHVSKPKKGIDKDIDMITGLTKGFRINHQVYPVILSK